MTRPYSHILYHENCYDGFGAAYAAWLVFGTSAEYIPVNHGRAAPDLPTNSIVLLCDFAYPRQELLDLKERVADLYVIDHHKTAQEALAGLEFAEFDLEHSGAYLTWQHFHGEPIPAFVLYLEDRDLWRFALPESKRVSQALRAYPFDFLCWHDLFHDVRRLKREGVVVERLTNQLVANMCDHARMVGIGGHIVPVANATVFFSEVGDELCRRFPKAPFAAYYLDRADGIRQWGFRSRGGFDTSVIAKAYGGGGHPSASGFLEPIPWHVSSKLTPIAAKADPESARRFGWER